MIYIQNMATLNNYILNNLENYNKELSETTVDIFIKYVNLINELIIESCENLYMKNINYNIYTIIYILNNILNN